MSSSLGLHHRLGDSLALSEADPQASCYRADVIIDQDYIGVGLKPMLACPVWEPTEGVVTTISNDLSRDLNPVLLPQPGTRLWQVQAEGEALKPLYTCLPLTMHPSQGLSVKILVPDYSPHYQRETLLASGNQTSLDVIFLLNT